MRLPQSSIERGSRALAVGIYLPAIDTIVTGMVMTANMMTMLLMIMTMRMRMAFVGWMLMRLMMTRMMGSNIMLSRVFLVMTSASKSWSAKPSDDKISLQLRRLRVSSRRMRRSVELQ